MIVTNEFLNNKYVYVCSHIIHMYTRIRMYSNTLYQLFYYSGGEDGTPLACAASKGHVKVINYLLGQNVDVNGGIKSM